MRKYFLCLTILWILHCMCVTIQAQSVYTYDANGNLTTGDGKFYEYNQANKLVRVRQDNATGPIIAEYVYDYSGLRIKKIENGVTTYYIDKHYEEEHTAGQRTNRASYYFANGQRVAKKGNSGNLSFIHSDHLGGTNAVTDGTGGLAERIKYYPFGDLRKGGNERYSFTGKEKDEATDFYYFEARYYNPGYRHFTQADVIIPNFYNPQSLNRYAYVDSNPLKYIDPSGNTKLRIPKNAKAGIVAGIGVGIGVGLLVFPEATKSYLYSVAKCSIGGIFLPDERHHDSNSDFSKMVKNDPNTEKYFERLISEAENKGKTSFSHEFQKPNRQEKECKGINLRGKGMSDAGLTIGCVDLEGRIAGTKQENGDWHIEGTLKDDYTYYWKTFDQDEEAHSVILNNYVGFVPEKLGYLGPYDQVVHLDYTVEK